LTTKQTAEGSLRAKRKDHPSHEASRILLPPQYRRVLQERYCHHERTCMTRIRSQVWTVLTYLSLSLSVSLCLILVGLWCSSSPAQRLHHLNLHRRCPQQVALMIFRRASDQSGIGCALFLSLTDLSLSRQTDRERDQLETERAHSPPKICQITGKAVSPTGKVVLRAGDLFVEGEEWRAFRPQ
jgi:hypothetical protein